MRGLVLLALCLLSLSAQDRCSPQDLWEQFLGESNPKEWPKFVVGQKYKEAGLFSHPYSKGDIPGLGTTFLYCCIII